MTPFADVLAKRAILGVLGLSLVLPQLFWTYQLLAHPTRENLTVLLIQVGGALVGPVLLPHWSRWTALKPDHRFGTMFLSAYVLPVTLWALVAGYEDGLVVVILLSAPLAFGITALWWAVLGHRREAAAVPRAAT